MAAPIAAWVAQPFTTGELVGAAVEGADDPFRTTVSAAAWVSWALVLVAMAVPRPVTLTMSRLGAAGGMTAAMWAAFDVAGETDPGNAGIAIGLVAAALAVFFLHLPGIGDRFVDGISYGDERRFLLRAPGPVLLLLIVPATAVVIVGVAAGPLMLADQRWPVGAVLTALGWTIAWFPLNALHRLTARFVVFVPNGLVLHDPGVLREPALFVKREIASLAPAPTDTVATDLTSQALGLALELRLAAPVDLPVVTGRTTTEERSVRSLLIAPTRPGAVMHTAVERGITIA